MSVLITEDDIVFVAQLLQKGDIDYVNGNLPENYYVKNDVDELPEWIISANEWLKIIQEELLPVAKEQSLSLREIMNRYINGGSEFDWPKELPWNIDFEQDDPRMIMRQALLCVDEKEFPKSIFEH